MRSTTVLFAALFALTFGLATAQETVIDGFEGETNIGSWSDPVSPSPQTHNQAARGVLTRQTVNVTEGAQSQKLAMSWTLPGTDAASNAYYPGGALLFWSVRINIGAPAALPSFSNTETLKADVYNPTSNQLDFALCVRDSDGGSQLERGPFVTLNANGWTTYEWDLATQAPTSFITGNGVLDGTTSKLAGYFLYTETAPVSAAQDLYVDNIRIGGPIAEPPAPPVVMSLEQGAEPGQLVVNWKANTEADLAGYNVYIGKNEDFGKQIGNRFTFPTVPVAQVLAPATSVVLDDLASTTTYIRVTAYDTDGFESTEKGTWGAFLSADGSPPEDLVVLDLKRWGPGEGNYMTCGYSHMIVYNAQSLQDLGRTFVSANGLAIDEGSVTLTPKEDGIVIWSAGLDGRVETSDSLSEASAAALTAYVNAGGNLMISGTSIGTDFGQRTVPALDNFLGGVLRSLLATSNVAANEIAPVGPFAEVGNFFTGNNIWDVAAYGHNINEGLIAVGSMPGANYVSETNPDTAMVYYGNKLVYMGFAFETVRNSATSASFSAARATRTALLGAVVEYLFGTPPAAAATWQMYE